MIIEGRGNLITTEADALVNTVNTVGIMGKGVALQFKQAFPENFKEYERACRHGEVRIGQMFVTYTGMFVPRLIVNFPTKQHWRAPAQLEDVRQGLVDLISVVRREQIRSIAIPPLGCGLGGLRWEQVRPLIEQAFAELQDIQVILFAPGGAQSSARVIRTARPPMSAWVAGLIKLVEEYAMLGFATSHQEAQKLVYLLHEAGEPIKVQFVKGEYGPYDQGMKHALIALDGHYVNGFGEGKRLDPVTLVDGAAEEAQAYLSDMPETRERIRRVTALIEGFESPYGLELLTTVHWVVTRDNACTEDDAVRLSVTWNMRKARSLIEDHLRVAYQTLQQLGWIESLLVS